MANIVKKVSMKSLIGNVTKFIPTKEITEKRGDREVVREVPAIGETTWLANIVGIARNVKRGTSTYGDWEALLGDFMAEPLVGEKAGKRVRTGQIFLPDVILNMIAGAMNGANGIEFNFKVGIVAVPTDGDKPSATGYEYVADILVEPTVSDPLTALLDKAAAKALPAPEEKAKEKANA
jgi:hypothetical protein